MSQKSLRAKYARTYQEARQKPKVIGIRLLRSDNVEFENYELTYVRYKVRKDVPRSKAIVEADWSTSTAK